jgi:hypothetical protein
MPARHPELRDEARHERDGRDGDGHGAEGAQQGVGGRLAEPGREDLENPERRRDDRDLARRGEVHRRLGRARLLIGHGHRNLPRDGAGWPRLNDDREGCGGDVVPFGNG